MATERTAAIVTGAASGIGRAMTLGLLGAGVDVAAVDRNDAALAALAATVQDTPGTLQPCPPTLRGRRRSTPIVSAVLEPLRQDRRAGEQRRHRPGLDQGRTSGAIRSACGRSRPSSGSAS